MKTEILVTHDVSLNYSTPVSTKATDFTRYCRNHSMLPGGQPHSHVNSSPTCRSRVAMNPTQHSTRMEVVGKVSVSPWSMVHGS